MFVKEKKKEGEGEGRRREEKTEEFRSFKVIFKTDFPWLFHNFFSGELFPFDFVRIVISLYI